MADTVKTVKSSGGDYSSLSAWEAGQQKSITAGNREIAECYAFDDTAQCVITGWTVPNGAEIIVRGATGERHNGTWGNGYRMSYSGSIYFGALDVSEDYVTIDGVAMRFSSAAGGGAEAPFRVAASAINPKILNCIIYRTTADETACYLNSITGTGVIANTVVVTAGTYAVIFQAGNWQIYNCSFAAASGTALRAGYSVSGTIKVKNTYLHGSTCWTDDGSGSVTFTTCRHSTAQSITGSTGSTAYSTANFTNVTAGSENLTPPSGSALIDAGTDLSADADYPFSTDILGTTRSGTWEVGPFNYAAAAGGQPSMRRFGGTPGMTPGPQSFGRSW